MDPKLFRLPSPALSARASSANYLAWVLVALISASYFIGLTPGHILAQDDFAAYVMHAANLVEGHPYGEIRYVANPDAPWISPASGYPPAYPLLLAPVYRLRGFDLHAMKIVTVFTFAVFLAAFAAWVRPLVSPLIRVIAVALVGLSPAFWSYRDFISSEFPYLMFSFLALAAIRRATASHTDDSWRPGWAVLLAILIYAAYATRTIGIALPAALACAEFARYGRPTRFLILTLALLAPCIALQAVLLTSPAGYVNMAHFSAAALAADVWSYAKSITFAWENGVSRTAQAVVGLVLTTLGAISFVRRNRGQVSAEAWYLLAYLAILIAWGIQIGLRGLLPILPIYLTYVLLGISDVAARMNRPAARAFLTAVTFCIVGSYALFLRQPTQRTSAANIQDASAQELFSFLRTQTAPSDRLVFSKPRILSLFTGRMATSLGAEEAPGTSAGFLEREGVRYLVHTSWNPPAYHRLITQQRAAANEVFRNRDFQVFRLRFANEGPTEPLASR